MGRVDSCSRCCIGISIPGVIFLTIIGFLFDKQPLYTAYEVEDPDAAASNCYMGAVIYLAMVILSVVGILYEKKKGPTDAVTSEEETGLLAWENDGYGSLGSMSAMPPNSNDL